MAESPARSTSTWWFVGLALAASWIAYLRFFGPSMPVEGPLGTPPLNPPSRSQQADYDWTLNDMDGAPVPFSNYRGRAVFLNVWATWCPPCVAELPSIARLAANPRLKEVAFVCASVDQSGEKVRSFLSDKSYRMTVLHASGLPDVFATEGIPATFLIAPDGRVASSTVGSAEWDDPAVVDFLARLAAEGRAPEASTAAAPAKAVKP